jgi:hypothetical protein
MEVIDAAVTAVVGALSPTLSLGNKEQLAQWARDNINTTKRGDEDLARNRTAAGELRTERDALKVGWTDLIQTGNHDEIARRSMRLAEIDRELVRLGV